MVVCGLLLLHTNVVLAGFPGAFSGCPSAPQPQPLPNPLPPLVTKALENADAAAHLIQSLGMDEIATGLYSDPTAAISVGVGA